MSLRTGRRSGSPYYWITGTVEGQRIRQSSGTSNERLAGEIAAALEIRIVREAIHGRPLRRRSFAEVALSYLDHAGPHTDDTRAKVARLLEHFGPGMMADDVDQEAIDGACAALLRPNPVAATRLRQVISPARAILTHGAKRRMCAMPLFDPGKPSPGRTEWLRPAQVDALLAAAAPHLRPLLTFLAGTGARLGEALHLEWRDVDLDHGRARLRDTKNGTHRDVDLCQRVVATLLTDPRAEIAAARAERQGKPPPNVVRARTGRVFLTRAGRPYAERRVQGGGQISTAWAGAIRRAGIEQPVSPHSLRHSWATWEHARHLDLIRLRTDGGWSSVTLVERYAHLCPTGLVGEIEAWRAGNMQKMHISQKRKDRA